MRIPLLLVVILGLLTSCKKAEQKEQDTIQRLQKEWLVKHYNRIVSDSSGYVYARQEFIQEDSITVVFDGNSEGYFSRPIYVHQDGNVDASFEYKVRFNAGEIDLAFRGSPSWGDGIEFYEILENSDHHQVWYGRPITEGSELLISYRLELVAL